MSIKKLMERLPKSLETKFSSGIFLIRSHNILLVYMNSKEVGKLKKKYSSNVGREDSMKVLLVLNRNPYDGTDVTWNALRLGEQLLNEGVELMLFLMNDSVDLARDGIEPPEGYLNLTQMLQGFIERGVRVKVCGTCLVRCGVHKGKPLIIGAVEAKMRELAEWIAECEKVISF